MFDDTGCLPPGVHASTPSEIEARFGLQSELRRLQMESVRWMVDLARRAGVQRVVLNGSFLTDIMEPRDVDCVLRVTAGFPTDPTAEEERNAGLPFLEIALVDQPDFDEMVSSVFATDRFGTPKGMVEIV
jgi:hypothetical protein